MNNSKMIENVSLEIDMPIDLKPMMRQRETELVEIIEALEHISGSQYWKVLEKMFNKDFESLQNRLRNEKNPTEIYRLQGKLAETEKFNLGKELQAYRLELQNIRNKLNANN